MITSNKNYFFALLVIISNTISYSIGGIGIKETECAPQIPSQAKIKYEHQSDDNKISDTQKKSLPSPNKNTTFTNYAEIMNPEVEDSIYKKLSSNLPQDQITAIAFIAENGTLSAKKLVREMALHPKPPMDESVQAAAILTSKWKSDFEQLINIYQQNKSSKLIKEAVMNAADMTGDPTLQENLSHMVLSDLSAEMDPAIIINMLEYLSTKGDFFLQQSRYLIESRQPTNKELLTYLKSNKN